MMSYMTCYFIVSS